MNSLLFWPISWYRLKKLCHFLKVPIRIHRVWILSYQLESQKILHHIFAGWYEHDEVNQIIPRLQEDDVVLELGAAIGVITCAMAKKVKKGRIVAFEPNPVTADLCERHLKLNSIRNVQVRRSIVGLSEGVAKFYVAPDYWSSSLEYNPGSTEIECKVENLKSILLSQMPSVVVMDIEGGEYELLGSGFLTRATSVRLLVAEFHPVANFDNQIPQLEKALDEFTPSVPLLELHEMLRRGHQPTVSFTRC